MSDLQELAAIEAEFNRAGYELDLDEMPGGSWIAVYRDQQSTIGTRTPQGAGQTKLAAARVALEEFRAAEGASS